MVNLRCQFCRESNTQGLDTMLFLILEKDEKVISRFPLYLSAEAISQMPELEKTFTDLPSLLELIYNSGKNNENINFIKEDILLKS